MLGAISHSFQVDLYYLFHPSSRVDISGDTRLRMTAQEAEEFAQELRE